MKSVVNINAPNTNAYFMPISSTGWELRAIPMKASVAMSDGAWIGVEISGNTTTGNATLMPATNASGANFIGILAEKIATTDTDFATAGKLKQVWVPTNLMAEAKFKVWAGTFTSADVNKTVSFHSNSLSLAVDTAGAGAEIVEYVSSTEGKCRFTLPRTVTA